MRRASVGLPAPLGPRMTMRLGTGISYATVKLKFAIVRSPRPAGWLPQSTEAWDPQSN
jgi:hypothetical protein